MENVAYTIISRCSNYKIYANISSSKWRSYYRYDVFKCKGLYNFEDNFPVSDES